MGGSKHSNLIQCFMCNSLVLRLSKCHPYSNFGQTEFYKWAFCLRQCLQYEQCLETEHHDFTFPVPIILLNTEKNPMED